MTHYADIENIITATMAEYECSYDEALLLILDAVPAEPTADVALLDEADYYCTGGNV